ncbi:hypothetical protein [Propionicimonas sp.]|uniref:hypothetical protein n=1 Tax=Propionicimonas sp. TaxID=1955623 RepID=UPI00183F5528|nr:hypothetical protein [Propionicimonas sp.]MBA3019638.1 hypothetical protein [Propionicimonas sp.]MBU4208017.1 hypothetical protein [Actinomycetota bacterium]MCG2805757.1 hypothetical protein [Propionicimonas sp.]
MISKRAARRLLQHLQVESNPTHPTHERLIIRSGEDLNDFLYDAARTFPRYATIRLYLPPVRFGPNVFARTRLNLHEGNAVIEAVTVQDPATPRWITTLYQPSTALAYPGIQMVFRSEHITGAVPAIFSYITGWLAWHTAATGPVTVAIGYTATTAALAVVAVLGGIVAPHLYRTRWSKTLPVDTAQEPGTSILTTLRDHPNTEPADIWRHANEYAALPSTLYRPHDLR